MSILVLLPWLAFAAMLGNLSIRLWMDRAERQRRAAALDAHIEGVLSLIPMADVSAATIANGTITAARICRNE